jgi:O-antigen/teichoic acid export membrane protein
LRFGLHSTLTTTVIGGRRAIQSLALSRLAGVSAVGLFDVASFPVAIAETASAPLRLATFPEQAALSARGRLADLRRGVAVQTWGGLALGILGAMLGWILLPVLLPAIYSARFAEAVWPARVLLVAAVAKLATSWAKTLPVAIGKPVLRTGVMLADFALLTGLMLAFARAGAMGAAVALTTSSVLIAVAWGAIARRMLRPVPARPPLPPALLRPAEQRGNPGLPG